MIPFNWQIRSEANLNMFWSLWRNPNKALFLQGLRAFNHQGPKHVFHDKQDSRVGGFIPICPWRSNTLLRIDIGQIYLASMFSEENWKLWSQFLNSDWCISVLINDEQWSKIVTGSLQFTPSIFSKIIPSRARRIYSHMLFPKYDWILYLSHSDPLYACKLYFGLFGSAV